jgi:serine/threonine protein kinase/Tol biopolymer transport system component
MTDIDPGFILKSRYKVLDLLGKGGMGEVYLAEDQSLANQVAVKVNHNLSPNASAQFIREARLLASLKHPNLPRVIDYFTENDSQYLVMDFIPGENLRTIVEQKTPLSTPLILQWAEQLGNALSYLHSQNPPIYHRDIKPANIKITPKGEVILVDFGIAKTGEASQETLSGAWGYTPGYAPPEQVSGLRTGPYSDQFSLAATLYYLFAGKPPADSAKRMIGEEELIPLTQLNPTIPAHTASAIEKALSIKPEARFSTVQDFIASLCNTSPIPDPSSSQNTLVGQRTVAAVGRGAPLVPPPSVAPPAQVAPALPAKKKSPLGWIIGALAVLGLGIAAVLVLRNLSLRSTPSNEPPPTLTPMVIVITAQSPETPAPATEEPTAAQSIELTSTAEPLPAETEAPVYTSIGKGGKVAFVSNRQADGFDQIWLMDVMQNESGQLVGVNPVQLTFSEGDKANPAWSPDGSKLLYSGFSKGFTANGNPLAMDIWLLDLSVPDAQAVDISLRQRDDKYPSWSPVGDMIVYTSYYRDDGIPQLFMTDPQGEKQTRLSLPFAESYATWTPNAEFLLFVQSTGNLNVVYMRDKYSQYTNGEHKFDRMSDEGRLGSVSQPNLSLDGALLAYTQTSGSKTNIYVAPFADRGKTITALTSSGKDSWPYWSPDGQWLLFSSTRDGNAEIYIMDKNGEQVTNLTNLASQDKEPAWQPVPFPLP